MAETKPKEAARELEEYRRQRQSMMTAKPSGEGKMRVRIFSLAKGLQVYEKVLMIHVKSVKYDLLIMEDYFPILGEIDGSVVVTFADDELVLDGVKGFFCHEHNSFFLLLKESSNVG